MSHPTNFRVWSQMASKWMSNIVLNDVGIPILLYSEKKGKKVEHSVFLIDNYQPVVQWSVGLNDKNGREIYEGDKVKYYTNSQETEDTVGVVEWKDGQLFPQIDGKHIFTYKVEVVGNIFEDETAKKIIVPEITSVESVEAPKETNDKV